MGQSWRERMRYELNARVEEFYNQCNSSEDGRFCEGSDGPGRKRDTGTEDLGEKGTVQTPEKKKRYGGMSDSERSAKLKENYARKDAEEAKRQARVSKNQARAEENRVKAVEEEEKEKVRAQSDEIKDDADYGGLKGKIKKRLDAKKFEVDIEQFKEKIAKEESNIKRDQSGHDTPGHKANIEKYKKRIAEVEERYKKWRERAGG